MDEAAITSFLQHKLLSDNLALPKTAQSSEPPPRDWSSLPQPILYEVLLYLDEVGLSAMSAVSKALHTVIEGWEVKRWGSEGL